MLSKVWNYLTNKFIREPQPVPATEQRPKGSKSRMFLQKPTNTIIPSNPLPLAPFQPLRVDYKLVLEKDSGALSYPESQQENLQKEDSMVYQIGQLTEQIENLRVSDDRIELAKQKQGKLHPPESISAQKRDQLVKRQFELKKQYQTEIVNFLELKYSKERADYQMISFEDFERIKEYWSLKSRGHVQFKTTSFNCVQKLTYKSLGGLHFGDWLNDDVINIYIEMMQKRYIEGAVTPYRILNSYFASNTLQKTETQIQRFLKKKNLDKNHILIMPINNRNHWYLSVFQNGNLSIFDSLKHNQNYYMQNPIFKNAIKFSKFFYDSQYKLVVDTDYPQQDNYYDCGVFMLMGMRDILSRRQWSYHQGDIKFKRIQIAKQVLQEKLVEIK